ncbi:MAG: hypothetical protein HFI65_00785 [Lachnospiraceae bacterium]|nr:hypothetical protein [Lachnospiraceae bacterium]
MQVLSSAANFGANILLSMAVSGVVSFFDDLIHAEERAIEKGQQARQNIQSLGDAYRNQTGNAGELAAQYDRLSDSMAKSGEARPGTEEYEEFLQVSRQLAELCPELVSGYDSSGNAILNLGNNAESASMKVAQLAEQQRKLTNLEIEGSLDDLYKGVMTSTKQSQKDLDKYKKDLSDLNDLKTLIDPSGIDALFSGNTASFSISRDSEYADDYMNSLEQAFKNAGLTYGEHFENYRNTFGDSYTFSAFNLNPEQVSAVKAELKTQFSELSDATQSSLTEANDHVYVEMLRQKQQYSSLSASMFDWVTTTDDFALLEDDSQDMVRSILSKIDYSHMVLNENGSSKSMEELKDSLMNDLVYTFSDPSLDAAKKKAWQGLFSLDASGMTSKEYQEKIDQFVKDIAGGDEEAQQEFKLKFGFTIETPDGRVLDSQDTLLKEISEKTGIGTEDLGTLTGGQLEVAYHLTAKSGNDFSGIDLEGFKEAIQKEMDSEAFSIDALSGTYRTLSDEIQTVNSLIASQASGQSLSVDSYNSLISQCSDYGNALEVVGGRMQLNTEILKKLRDEHVQEAIAANDAAKQLNMADYQKNSVEISRLSEELEKQWGNPTVVSGIEAHISALQKDNDKIVNTCAQLDLMNEALRESTGSYQAWKDAQNAPESGDMFDDALKAMDNILNVFDEDSDEFQKTGTAKYQAALEFLVPDSVSSEGEEAIQKYMEDVQSYLTFDENGNQTGLNLDKFLETAESLNLMELDETGENYRIAGEKSLEDFAKGMGLSVPLVQAIFGELSEYGKDFELADDITSVENEIAHLEEQLDYFENNSPKIGMDTDEWNSQKAQLEAQLNELRQKRITIPVTTFLRQSSDLISAGLAVGRAAAGSASALGTLGTKSGKTTLVGELGREIVVDSRTGKWRTVGDNGAEFVYLPAGAIVFNHAQSEALLERGWVNSRGTALAGGTLLPDRISISDARDNTEKARAARTEIASLSSGSLAGNMAKAAASAEDFKDAMNWAEVRLDRIDTLFGWLKKDIEDTADNLSAAQTIGELNDAIQAGTDYARTLNEAAAGYMQYARSVGLSAEYADRIHRGAMDIQTIGDETLKKQIDEYTKWYEKAVSCYDKVRSLNSEIKKLQLQKLDAVVDWADYRIDYQDALGKRMQAYMDLADAGGIDKTQSQYRYLIDRQVTTRGKMEDKLSSLKAEFQSLMDRGVLQKYSGEWHTWMSTIYELEAAIVDTDTAIEKLQKESRELDWAKFERGIDVLSRMDEELSAVSGLYEDSMLFGEDGTMTASGLSAAAIYGQQAELAAVRAGQYSEAMKKLRRELSNGSLSQKEYNEQVSEFAKLQQGAAKEVKEYRDRLVSLISEGIQKETEAYRKLNDARKEALSTQKEADSYKKQVAEKSSAVSDLEAEYASLVGVSGRSAQARREQLLKEIDDAKTELKELQEDHAYEEQLKYLDRDSEAFETSQNAKAELLKTDLNAQNAAISELLSDAVTHSGEVLSDIRRMTANYGMELKDALALPWQSASSAMKEYLVILNSMGIGIGNVSGNSAYRPGFSQSLGTSSYSNAAGSVNSFLEDEVWKSIQHALATGGRYASGSRHVPRGMHLTNESGLEAILTKEGLLTPFVGTGTVFNAGATDVLYRFANAPERFLGRYLKPTDVQAPAPGPAVSLHYDSLITVNGDVIEDTIPSLSQIVAGAVPAVKQDLKKELMLLGKTVNLYR